MASAAAISAGTGASWSPKWSGRNSVEYPRSSTLRARAARSPPGAVEIWTPNRNVRGWAIGAGTLLAADRRTIAGMGLEWGGTELGGVRRARGDAADVYDVISAMPEAGKAEWGDSNYSMEFDDKGEVTSVDANIRYKVTMPTWVEVDQAPQAAQDEWNRFWSALEAHEQGHLDIARRQGERCRRRAWSARPKTAAEKEWNDTFAKIQKLSESLRRQHDERPERRHDPRPERRRARGGRSRRGRVRGAVTGAPAPSPAPPNGAPAGGPARSRRSGTAARPPARRGGRPW